MKLTLCSHLGEKAELLIQTGSFPNPLPSPKRKTCIQPFPSLTLLSYFCLIFSPCLVLLALSSKHGQAHMHTPHSPKVIAESQRFPGTRKNNKDWGLVHFLPGAAVLLERRPPVNSLHVEQGKPMQSERQKRVIFTDLGSLLSAASCLLFFIFFPDLLEI